MTAGAPTPGETRLERAGWLEPSVRECEEPSTATRLAAAAATSATGPAARTRLRRNRDKLTATGSSKLVARSRAVRSRTYSDHAEHSGHTKRWASRRSTSNSVSSSSS